MQKANIIKSSDFHMDIGDVLHILLRDEQGAIVTLDLQETPSPGEVIEEVPNQPVAKAATLVTSSSFTANWNFMQNSTGYYLDVATDSAFTSFVTGYNNKNIGNAISDNVVGLNDATVYYYQIRAYNNVGTSISSVAIQTTTALENVADIDGNVYTYVTIGTQQWMVENLRTTKYADGTPIPNISNYNDWFLPSKDELNAIYTELYLQGVGGLTNQRYHSSSEMSASWFSSQQFSTGVQLDITLKNSNNLARPIRSFTSITPSYSLRDIGPAGGYVFYKNGNNYLEASPQDTAINIWSNVDALAIGTTGTAIGTGQANTTAIINQGGHVSSTAKLCNDLTSDMLWAADTTGAYCYYNNDIANKADYGALYNGYAVNNAHGLAPTGWRVPSDADWAILNTFIGGNSIAGGILKEEGLAHWTTPNTGATDDYGFRAVGGGTRDNSGVFSAINEQSVFWQQSLARRIIYNGINIETLDASSTFGYSVRCMRDVI